MKLFIILLIFTGCFYNCLTDTDDNKSEQQHTICTACNCNTKTKTLDCENLHLFNIFSKEDWVSVNESGIVLDIVNFDSNGIANVTAFPELNIRILILRNNLIDRIEFGAFRELQKLEELDLSFNRLTYSTIRPQVFDGKVDSENPIPFPLLRILNLGNNNIHTLHSDVFQNFPNLEKLSLNSNPFLSFDHGTAVAISGISKLKYLDLSNMELTTLPELLLHAPRELEVLNLTENLMTSLPSALKSAISLTYLNLDDNLMTDFNGENAFPSLPKLETLSISFMVTLKSIGQHSLSNLPSLKTLLCTNNPRLATIHEEALSRQVEDERVVWPPLKELFLHNNNLSTLHSGIVERWEDLEILDIRMNPWTCDCNNQWIVDTLMGYILDKTPDLAHEIKCNLPTELLGEELIRLKLKGEHLSCLNEIKSARGGSLFVYILVGLLAGIIMSSAIIIIYRRGCFGYMRYSGPSDYSRNFYNRAVLREEVN